MALSFRSKHPGRHLRQDGQALPADAPAAPHAMTIPVPVAQREAERASGPQRVLDPETHPYAAQEAQPAEIPVPAEAAQYAGHPQQRRTEAYTPDFAQVPALPRRYAPHSTQPAEVPPPPLEQSPVGDALNAGWQWCHESSGEAVLARQRAMSLSYPRRDLNATFGDYRALMSRIDEITGTRGTDRWPLQALPAADERWGALTGALKDAEDALREADPGLAGGHARLREAAEAAPDVETALRLARNAAGAGVTGRMRFAPVEPVREQAGDAA